MTADRRRRGRGHRRRRGRGRAAARLSCTSGYAESSRCPDSTRRSSASTGPTTSAHTDGLRTWTSGCCRHNEGASAVSARDHRSGVARRQKASVCRAVRPRPRSDSGGWLDGGRTRSQTRRSRLRFAGAAAARRGAEPPGAALSQRGTRNTRARTALPAAHRAKRHSEERGAERRWQTLWGCRPGAAGGCWSTPRAMRGV
jgi:hypothetical protein